MWLKVPLKRTPPRLHQPLNVLQVPDPHPPNKVQHYPVEHANHPLHQQIHVGISRVTGSVQPTNRPVAGRISARHGVQLLNVNQHHLRVQLVPTIRRKHSAAANDPLQVELVSGRINVQLEVLHPVGNRHPHRAEWLRATNPKHTVRVKNPQRVAFANGRRKNDPVVQLQQHAPQNPPSVNPLHLVHLES